MVALTLLLVSGFTDAYARDCGFDQSPDKISAGDNTIVVLGDSLSAAYGIDAAKGWVALAAERLKAEGTRARVVNASISGATTTDGLELIDGVLSRHKPCVVILELGGNDGLRGQPIATIKDNLLRLIDTINEAGSAVVLLGMRLPPNYGPAYTEGFYAIYTELARTRDLPLVPFMLEGIALTPQLMQADGIHPTAAAQGRILDNVWPKLTIALTKIKENSAL